MVISWLVNGYWLAEITDYMHFAMINLSADDISIVDKFLTVSMSNYSNERIFFDILYSTNKPLQHRHPVGIRPVNTEIFASYIDLAVRCSTLSDEFPSRPIY